jgi:hypothetical protein
VHIFAIPARYGVRCYLEVIDHLDKAFKQDGIATIVGSPQARRYKACLRIFQSLHRVAPTRNV